MAASRDIARRPDPSLGGPDDWRRLNRANWDERVPIHTGAKAYDLSALRDGRGTLHAIEEAELGDVKGLRVLHLQCHFGRDTLTLAQRGAEVVGVDFSAPAVSVARQLAGELGLEGRARFVESDVYAAPAALAEAHSFDLVYVTWGAICWLPDMRRWAQVVAHFLKPGGRLYLAEGHPAAYVLDDDAPLPDGMPGFFAPYFGREPLVLDDERDYADEHARLANKRTVQWLHPLSETVGSIIAAGLSLDWLHEHDRVPWRMFRTLERDAAGMYHWPRQPWLPLAFSLMATRTSVRG
jgi:SAM-dependent methyltransferase